MGAKNLVYLRLSLSTKYSEDDAAGSATGAAAAEDLARRPRRDRW